MKSLHSRLKSIAEHPVRTFVLLLGLAAAAALIFNLMNTPACQVIGGTGADGKVYIIDPGHGGFDGGAVSPSGTVESQINLEVAARLDLFMRYIGQTTRMTRRGDDALNEGGASIREKKVSDLKNRVRLVNSVENGILVSIHQNMFTDPRYSGAQVFYGKVSGSRELAEAIQKNIGSSLDLGNDREVKPVPGGVYLMSRAECTAVLIECGFMSNFNEEQKLKDPNYQKKIAVVIGLSLLSQ